ncbi:MAG: OmpH family outer membrane protein [Pseudomonadota bacterium]
MDFERLVKAAPQFKALQQQLAQQFGQRSKELENSQKALERDLENFRRDSTVMGAGELERKQAELKRRDLDFQRERRELQEDFNIAQNEGMGKLQREILVAIQDYAEKKKYDLLVSGGVSVGVLYASDKADITDDLLKAVEKAAR